MSSVVVICYVKQFFDLTGFILDKATKDFCSVVYTADIQMFF